MPIHLCGFHDSESAPSTPRNRWRSSGSSIAEPAIAASTWTHAPCRAATSTIAGTGSTAVVAVVPIPATTIAGHRPAASSAAIASASDAGSMA